MNKRTANHWTISLILGISLVLGAAHLAGAENVPETIQRIIEKEFPGAEITEVEQEMWQDGVVTEVELISTDGIHYEVYVSEDGQILKVEEEDGGLPWIGGELSIGMAARGEREIYKDVGSEFELVPFIRYENGPFEIKGYDGLDASFKLFGTSSYEIALKGSADFEDGYDSDDSDYFEDMDELGTLYGVGLKCETNYAGWKAKLEFKQDVSGEHDGQEVELALGYPWMAGGFEFQPTLSATWLSEKTVDYFYGVSAKEAKSDRPAYSPGASYEIGAELMILRPLFGNFTVVGIVEISSFGNNITDSPLVDEDYEIEGVLGIMYTF
jgi:outer membrane protein